MPDGRLRARLHRFRCIHRSTRGRKRQWYLFELGLTVNYCCHLLLMLPILIRSFEQHVDNETRFHGVSPANQKLANKRQAVFIIGQTGQ